MTTQHDDPKTEKLLAAALALREYQLSFIRASQAIAVVELKKKGLEAVLSDAEFELAEADALYANTRLKVLRLIREKRRLEIIQTMQYPHAPAARTELWRLCATGSPEEIIAAANHYSATTSAYWEAVQPKNKAEQELNDAHEALAAASTARKAAVQKRGKAKAAVQAVEAELIAALRARPLESVDMFALEQAVTNAALEMNGTSDREFSYSYENTADLGITGPGLELPKADDSDPETVVRYWERHAYGRKPEPAREE